MAIHGVIRTGRSVTLLAACVLCSSCATTFFEMRGECVLQQWKLIGYVARSRVLCSLPAPGPEDPTLRERNALPLNPFPGIFELRNPADTPSRNLLEDTLDYSQDHEDNPDHEFKSGGGY